MPSPISNDRISSPSGNQGRGVKRNEASNGSDQGRKAETHGSEVAAAAQDKVDVSNTAKTKSQGEVARHGLGAINNFEDASKLAASLKQSVLENGSAALAAHNLQSDQISGLLQSASA